MDKKVKIVRDAIELVAGQQSSGGNLRLEELGGGELPRLLGKLIADLDLQKEFLLMGKHVRSFKDASIVLTHLTPLIEQRIVKEGTIATLNVLEAILALCREAGTTGEI